MADINNKEYSEIITKLEALSNGVKKYKDNNPRIAVNFKEADIQALRTELENLREAYIQKETEARKAYDVFAQRMQAIKVSHSSDSRIIKGIFGRTAEELKDFGVSPERPKPKLRVKADRKPV